LVAAIFSVSILSILVSTRLTKKLATLLTFSRSPPFRLKSSSPARKASATCA